MNTGAVPRSETLQRAAWSPPCILPDLPPQDCAVSAAWDLEARLSQELRAPVAPNLMAVVGLRELQLVSFTGSPTWHTS